MRHLNSIIPCTLKIGTIRLHLTVYNALGQEVATLVDEEVPAGTHKVTWDASGLPTGIYFARIEVHSDQSVGAKNFTATKKMVLMK